MKINILLLISIVFILLISPLSGICNCVTSFNIEMNTDTVPEFQMDKLKISIPKNGSGSNEKDNTAIYNIEGMIPSKKENSLISIKKGSKTYDNSKNPYTLLCRLLKAYEKGDVDEVKKLYAGSDTGKIDVVLSGATAGKGFLEFMKAIRDFQVLIMFKSSDGVLVIVKANTKENQSMVIPFLTSKEKDQWYLRVGSGTSQMFSDIMLYLMAGKEPQKLIISSKPKK